MARNITVALSDDDEAALLHDLIDIDDWVQKAVRGKINSCTQRMAAEAQAVLIADPTVTSMPASQPELVRRLRMRADYKNRAAREADLIAGN